MAGSAAVAYQGLDYSSISPTLDLLGISRARWVEIFAGLRMMELAALAVLNARKS